MELDTLKGLLETKDFEKIKDAVVTEKLLYVNNAGYASDKGTSAFDFTHLTAFRKQYYPHFHDITDTQKRPDKLVSVEGGVTKVPVARLPIPLQMMIVSRAASFLCGNPIEIEADPAKASNEEALLEMIQKTWEDNKLDYESKHLAKLMMSETECAELWYVEPAEPDYWKDTPNAGSKFRLRVKIISHSHGDVLFPAFNAAGDLVAFARMYRMAEGDKVIDHFDIYTDTQNFYTNNSSGTFTQERSEPNMIGKIPVIYYSQAFPEWFYVESLIERFETMMSNHADMNDYFGSPTVIVKGTVGSFSEKGEQGKVIEVQGENGDVKYLTWDQASGSLELEYKNLRSMIFDMTDTPDISIEQMKSLGTFSGIALKMLFMNAHLKAADKEETFGKSVQRRLNFLKAALAKINTKLEPGVEMSVKPKFTYYLPKDEKGEIDAITEAVAGGIMSKKSGVQQNPLVSDPDQELEQIAEEKAAEPVTTF